MSGGRSGADRVNTAVSRQFFVYGKGLAPRDEDGFARVREDRSMFVNDTLHDIMLFFHFIGLALGVGVSFTNMFLMRLAGSADTPETAGVIRSLPQRLAVLSTVGLGILWVTGLVMVIRWGVGPYPTWFWLKMVMVVALTAVVYVIYQTQAAIRSGDAAAASRMKFLGPAAGVSSLVVVLFAIFAFH